MNKIYRQSFWKANATQGRLMPMFITFSIIIIIFKLDDYPNLVNLFIFISLIILFFCILFISQYFYVTLVGDRLVIINGILPFIKGTYKYANIDKVIIGCTGGRTPPFIQVITPEKKSWRYVFGLVNRKQYANLIKDLQSRGVTVETFNLENYMK